MEGGWFSKRQRYISSSQARRNKLRMSTDTNKFLRISEILDKVEKVQNLIFVTRGKTGF